MACPGVAPAFGLRRLDSAFPLRGSNAQFPYPIGRRRGATICRWNTATEQDTSRAESQSGVKPPHSKASWHSSAPLAWLATVLGTPIESRPVPNPCKDGVTALLPASYSLGMFLRLLLVFLILCGAHQSRAVSVLALPEIVPVSDGVATVRWKLDSPAGGRFRYGLAEDKLDQTVSDGVGTEHSVTLKGLQPGARYFYSVGTSRAPLMTGTFVVKKGAAGPLTGKPAAPQPTGGTVTKPAEAKPAPTPKPSVRDAPATRFTWGNIGSLQDHFDRHGGDFSAKSPDDYAAQAWRFRERALAERLPMKLDTDGTVRAFDPKTRAFASFNRDGTAKTYFRPDSSSYWQRQPGKLIQTPPWVSQ